METTESTISKDEWIKANNLHCRPNAKGLTCLAIFILVVTFLLSTFVEMGNIQIFGLTLIGVIAVIILLEIPLYLLRVYIIKRYYRLSPITHQAYAIHFLENGLLFKSKTGEIIIEWKYIIKWRQNKEFILIYPTPNQYSIIPKRLEANGLDIASLENALLTHVGKEK